jgi:hypothetical protein
MTRRADIQQGTLALMVLKSLDVLGPLDGFGIARRAEQIFREQLALHSGLPAWIARNRATVSAV